MPLGVIYGTLGKGHCGMRESRIPETCYTTGMDGRWMSAFLIVAN